MAKPSEPAARKAPNSVEAEAPANWVMQDASRKEEPKQYKPHYLPDDDVGVLKPDGTTTIKKGSQIEKIEALGGKIISPMEAGRAAFKPDAKWEDSTAAKAFVASTGYLHGVTGGLSDIAFKKSYGDDSQWGKIALEAREGNQALDMASKLTGFAAGTVLTSGIGAGARGAAAAAEGAQAAKALASGTTIAQKGLAALEAGTLGLGKLASAPIAAIGKLGHMGGAAAANLAAKGLGALGASEKALTVGKAAADIAIRSGIEGALYNTANTITEDVLGDHKIAGEKLAASAGSGFLFGAGTGLALTGLAAGAKPVASKIRQGIASAADDVGNAVQGTRQNLSQRLRNKANDLSAKAIGVNASDLKSMGGDLETQIARSEKLGQLAVDEGIASKVSHREQNRVAKGRIEALGQEMHDFVNHIDDLNPIGEIKQVAVEGPAAKKAAALREQLAELEAAGPRAGREARHAERVANLKDRLAATEAKATKSVAEGPIDVGGIRDRIDREVMPAFMDRPDLAQEAKSVEATVSKYLGRIEQKPSFRNTWEVRRELDDLLDPVWNRNLHENPLTPREEALVKTRHIIEDMFTQNSIDAARNTMGDSAGQYWAALKGQYGDLHQIERITRREGAKEFVKKAWDLGLRERLSTNAGAAIGGLPGAAIGLATDMAMQRAPQVIIGALDKGASILGGQRIIMNQDLAMARAVKKALSHDAEHALAHGRQHATQHYVQHTLEHSLGHGADEAAAGMVASSPGRKPHDQEETADLIHQVKELASNPDLLTSRISGFIGSELANDAPKLTASLTDLMVKKAQYLAEKAPQPVGGINPISPTQKPRYTRSDLDDFRQRVDAAERPIETAIQSLQKNKLTRAHVETIKHIYPGLYADLQQRTLEEVVNLDQQGRPLPYAKQVQLGILLGIPTSPTLNGDFINTIQAVKQQGMPQETPKQQPVGGQMLKRKVDSKTSEQLALPSEQMAMGG